MSRVRFAKAFDRESYGARRSHVEEALRSPDGYCDTLERGISGETAHVAVHTRAVPNNLNPEFVWVVLSRVEHDIRTGLYAFRAYTGDVPITDPSDAVTTLQEFANHFGIEANWATGIRSRFIDYAKVPAQRQLVTVGTGRKFLAVLLARGLSEGQVEIRWSFILDTDKYEEALRQRHRIADDEPVTLELAPTMRGHIARSDLLSSQGTCWAVMAVAEPGVFWQVVCGPYHFIAGLSADSAYIIRNGVQVSTPLTLGERRRAFVAFSWSPTTLKVGASVLTSKSGTESGDDLREGVVAFEVQTPFSLPPKRVIRWARGKVLDAATTYKDEAEFRETVLEMLSSLQVVLDATGSQTSLWDSHREDGRVSHRPKRETDCQAWVRAQLFNIANAKNLEISYEPRVGSGSLDALVTGFVEAVGLARACIEFKLAHSADLDHGIEVQLPEYMHQKSCDFGIYGELDPTSGAFSYGLYRTRPSGRGPGRTEALLSMRGGPSRPSEAVGTPHRRNRGVRGARHGLLLPSRPAACSFAWIRRSPTVARYPFEDPRSCFAKAPARSVAWHRQSAQAVARTQGHHPGAYLSVRRHRPRPK